MTSDDNDSENADGLPADVAMHRMVVFRKMSRPTRLSLTLDELRNFYRLCTDEMKLLHLDLEDLMELFHFQVDPLAGGDEGMRTEREARVRLLIQEGLRKMSPSERARIRRDNAVLCFPGVHGQLRAAIGLEKFYSIVDEEVTGRRHLSG